MQYNSHIVESISISPDNNNNNNDNNNNNNDLIFPILDANTIIVLYIQDIIYRFSKMTNNDNANISSDLVNICFDDEFLKKLGISNDLINNNKKELYDTDFILKLFYKLYDNGLIYRDSIIVDWCYYLNTPVAENDINIITIDKPTNFILPNRQITLGNIYEIKFELYENSFFK